MRLNLLMPAAVVRFLQQEGLPARDDAAQLANRHVQEAWKQTSPTRRRPGNRSPREGSEPARE